MKPDYGQGSDQLPDLPTYNNGKSTDTYPLVDLANSLMKSVQNRVNAISAAEVAQSISPEKVALMASLRDLQMRSEATAQLAFETFEKEAQKAGFIDAKDPRLELFNDDFESRKDPRDGQRGG